MSIHVELAQIIKAFKPKRFLEIGVQSGANLLAVNCPYKVGIEPNNVIFGDFPHKIYWDTSDHVFASEEFQQEDNFDLIFIDGLHKFRQVVRDVNNSLKVLSRNGLIICHDVYPFDYLEQFETLTAEKCPGESKPWTGDVWKLIPYVSSYMTDLDFRTITNFPGFLCLWRNGTIREDKDANIGINIIDEFLVGSGLRGIPYMNIVSVADFISDVKQCCLHSDFWGL